MSTQHSIPNAWARLARKAMQAPDEEITIPLGFSTRVVARWQARPQETAWAMMEWFTWRAVAVAMLVMLGTAALGYEGISTLISNETSQVGDFINDIIES